MHLALLLPLVLLVSLSAQAAPRAPRPSGEACRSGPTDVLRLTGVAARGDLVFASGLRGRLTGIRWPEEAKPGESKPDASKAGEAARAFLAGHVGRDLAVVRRGEPDRWGRTPLDAAPEATEGADLASGLVAAGLAAVDTGEDDRLCRPGLLTLEDDARGARRGLWAERPIIAADDAAGLTAALGRFAVAEGRVRSVGERRSRIYLNFAAPDTQALTVTMTRRTWQRLGERGLDAGSLRGRRVRARGVLEAWRGPTFDLAAAELLEVLDAPAAPEAQASGSDLRKRERAQRR